MASFVETMGMPVYFEGRSCDCDVVASQEEIKMATLEALCSLGCETLDEESNSSGLIDKRTFTCELSFVESTFAFSDFKLFDALGSL